MSYDTTKNLLITAGFNHDIFIYDPYIDNEAVYRLKGHKTSINSIPNFENSISELFKHLVPKNSI